MAISPGDESRTHLTAESSSQEGQDGGGHRSGSGDHKSHTTPQTRLQTANTEV